MGGSISSAFSASEEWTIDEFDPLIAKYIKVEFHSSNQYNDWAGLWECEIWGDVPTSEEETFEENLPTDFVLHQNYPNPFNPSTTIRFDLPVSSKVSLRIYNSIGQEVANLVEENLGTGVHEYDFNAERLASGIYFYTIIANDFVQTKKMILIK